MGIDIDIVKNVKINNEKRKNEKYNEIPVPHCINSSVSSQNLNFSIYPFCSTGKLQHGQNLVL